MMAMGGGGQKLKGKKSVEYIPVILHLQKCTYVANSLYPRLDKQTLYILCVKNFKDASCLVTNQLALRYLVMKRAKLYINQHIDRYYVLHNIW